MFVFANKKKKETGHCAVCTAHGNGTQPGEAAAKDTE